MVSGHFVLGVDPGKMGRAAMLRCRAGDGAPHLVAVDTLDNAGLIMELAGRAELIVVEAQTASPQMGVRSAFSLGQGYGRLLGLLELVRRTEVLIMRPATWRGSMGLKTKRDGLALADALLGGYSALKTHDEADAVLLAWWGWKRVLEPVLVSAHETGDGW